MSRYQRFRTAVRLWVGRLGLTDWELQIRQAKFPKAQRCTMARVFSDPEARAALIEWNKRNPDPDWASPERIALHEVLHILVAPALAAAATTHSVDHPWVNQEEHALIMRLLTILEGCPNGPSD